MSHSLVFSKPTTNAGEKLRNWWHGISSYISKTDTCTPAEGFFPERLEVQTELKVSNSDDKQSGGWVCLGFVTDFVLWLVLCFFQVINLYSL